jgi:hypothetical protein
MRRMSLVRVKSPIGQMPILDPKAFTSCTAGDSRTEASSPLTLSGASPRRSWFNFFSRAAPRSLNKSDQPPLARAILVALGADELWASAQPACEALDVGLRFSKTLRCLKAVYPSGANSPTQTHACKFFMRMTSIVSSQGKFYFFFWLCLFVLIHYKTGASPSTYLHFEFRSGSAEEFLSLFSLFCGRMKELPGMEIDVGEE